MTSNKQNYHGFSLLEMAITLVIVSILAASIFTLIPVKQDQQNIDQVTSNLTRIQQAIDSFYNQNGYIPCPAPINAKFSDTNTQIGKSQDCSQASAPSGITQYAAPGGNIWLGAVPTRTLNLADDLMFDSWDNKIEYAVVKSLAVSETSFSGLTTTQSFFIINDMLGNQINTDSFSSINPKAVNIVAYVLLSHGKDGNGATNGSGFTKACNNSAHLDNQNCQNTNVYVDASFNSNSTGYYDDYVRWKTNQQQNRDGTLGGGSGNGVGSTAGNSYSLVGIFADQRTDNSNGGTCTAGAWNARALNTTIINELVNATLASNQITLGPGTYYINASAPAYNVGPHKIRISNITNSSTIVVGGSEDAVGTQSRAFVSAKVVLNTSTTIEIDHFCTNTTGSTDFGQAVVSTTDNSYNFAVVEIWQRL